MKYNEKNEFVYYGNVLPKLDIVTIGLSIVKYQQNQITYKELKQALNQLEIELNPLLYDFSSTMIAIKQYKKLKDKFEKEEYDPEHIDAFIVSSVYYKNVLVRYDRLMIENLAEYGDKYSKQILQSLLTYEGAYLKSRRIN